MFITLNIPKLIKENPYQTAKVEKIFSPQDFNIDDWYGGKIKLIAKLKESSLYLLVNSDMNTIDVAINTEELDNFSALYMREILKKYNLTYNATMGRDQILENFKSFFAKLENKCNESCGL